MHLDIHVHIYVLVLSFMFLVRQAPLPFYSSILDNATLSDEFIARLHVAPGPTLEMLL